MSKDWRLASLTTQNSMNIRDDCWWIDVQYAMDGKLVTGQWQDVGDQRGGPGVFRRCRIDSHNPTSAVQAYAHLTPQ